VIEVDPDIVETLRARGVSCLFGNPIHSHILQEANVQSASLVILTLPEGSQSQITIQNIREQNSAVPILARAHTRTDYDALLQAGASKIIQPELETSATMIRDALGYLKLPDDQASAYLDRFRTAVTDGQTIFSDVQAFPEVQEFAANASPLLGQSLREARIRERFGITVVAIKRESGELLVNPSADTIIQAGDKVRVFGLRREIDNCTSSRDT
jgi:Trk K+ transport system NAD-binding subunit